MRVVITHDFFETFGGAERVTAEIAAAFPEAPVYAILGRRSVAARMGIDDRVRTVLPGRTRLFTGYRALAPAYSAIVRAARLPDADVIVSSSYAYAHAFRAPERAAKLCYCHGPLRHLWSQAADYAAHLPGGAAGRVAFSFYTALARAADRAAADSTNAFLTQSPFTARLILQAYGREAQVLPPPIDCEVFKPSLKPPDDYFLFVGRLVEAYKRPSLVVDAFAQMPDRRLLIAGDGPALQSLRRRATPNVEFLGQLGDPDLVTAMQSCQAAVFPSIDDYGLVPLEVNACGRPVLAVRAGGSVHTLEPGVTGEFLRDQSAAAIIAAVRAFDSDRHDPRRIREHALQRSATRFREEIRAAAERLVGSSAQNRVPASPRLTLADWPDHALTDSIMPPRLTA
jgi:glycosyltransferase involved in cell wall biosynthesis